VLVVGALGACTSHAAADPCTPLVSPVACENSKPGSPPSQWDVDGEEDPSIQGFATDISVNRGETAHFKIDTPSSAYRLDIYRMGYYGGDGARLIDTVHPAAPLPQVQPPCATEPETGLVDCGNWAVSASWAVPADAVSGIYFTKLVREDQPSGGSHILFVVRDDDSHSDLLFQTSDTTWQAYNSYGGNSLYEGGPGVSPGRAYKVSYNRPLTVRGPIPEDSPFNAEYPMVRWLERNGYDVSYFTGVDADRRGAEILEHKAFLSVGHDEYWSAQQRENVEAARDAGVNLAFFSGNEVFWKTRWEDSIDGSGTDHRTLVCYKETHANDKIDPEDEIWTGTWRDPRFSSETDAHEPENALTGTIFTVNSGTSAIQVPATDGKMRLWRNTSVASLEPGQTATLADETLGFEWDEDLDNGFRPAGLFDLSSTTVEVPERVLDYGSSYGPGTATHHLTLYRAPSGALVFGVGTVQWSWGLDGEHDRGGPPADPRMQQATVNLFADMGVQPGAMQGDLTAATESSDTSPPSTTISAPLDGGKVESGSPATVSGIANDPVGEAGDGQVAAVEVSLDGGGSWRPAVGREHWKYTWTPAQTGKFTVLARAVDDSGNLEEPGDQISIEVVPHTCPCSIWDGSVTGQEDPDPKSVEVGVKFRSDGKGFVTGLRFYKTAGNTGTHTGYLWTLDGTEMAKATFTAETASGWQEVSLSAPVPIEADQTYIASYHAPNGHYAASPDYFSLVGADSAPLHALADGFDGPNGIYQYGAAGGLFDDLPQTYRSANYFVDVVFEKDTTPDTTPPQVTAQAPAAGAVETSIGAPVRASFDEAMDPGTIGGNFTLRDNLGNLVPATVTYSADLRRATLDPSEPLSHSTTYTATVKGGPGGATDRVGNPLAGDVTWSFTTAAPPPPPPSQGPGGPILVISNAANPFSRYYSEILRAEGLNEFATTDISNVTPAALGSYDVAVLGEGSLTAGQAQVLGDWVQAGGNLIAMRPDQHLWGLLGLSDGGGALSNAYLKVNDETGPGAGIVDQTIQFHGVADRYTTSGAQTIASLYSGAAGPATANPAVTLRDVGSNGGQAAAFSYDLARSVIYTRQGNPAWAGQDRDGLLPKRSDDLFFGGKAGDEQPDWVNLDKAQIPQADEQQRLLTNLIERMSIDRKPLPRFWFLPRDEKAAVVMTGDDHGNGGTVGRFEQYEADSPPGCVVAEWQCVRASSYIYPGTPIGDARAAAFAAAGFEIGLHVTTGCADWPSQGALVDLFADGMEAFATQFPSLPSPLTERTHCVVWSDWASQPKVERENGIRLDTNYYYWPGAWVQNRPGMFTGSGMPMRFADADGTMIDVYQAATQLTDESNQVYPSTIDTLLDNALGDQGFYGVFTANMHTDTEESANADAIVAAAQARGVPVVSAHQMLTWLDGRNQSSFESIEWSGNKLKFGIAPGEGVNGLRAMLPVESSAGDLVTLSLGGDPVDVTTRRVKGVRYAFFDATAGSYTAAYGPELTATAPASPANENSPKVFGSAPAGSTVRIYLTADCAGGAAGTGGASQFAEGIPVSVPDNWSGDLRVTATPAAGNASPCSGALAYIEDSSAPEVTIDTHPSVLSAFAAAEFKFSGTDGSGAGIQSYGCRLDSGAWGHCTSPKAYVSLSDGDHSFDVRATDNAGNTGVAATYAWTVDTTAPTVSIDSGPSGLTNDSTPTFQFHAGEPAGFECSLDTGAPDFGPCSAAGSHAPAAPLADGPYAFRVRATDGAANQGTATRSFTVDTAAPPAPELTASLPASPANDNSPEITGLAPVGSSVDLYEGAECLGSPLATVPASQLQSGIAVSVPEDSSTEFSATATSATGNISACSEPFTYLEDSTVPTMTIDSTPPSLSAGSAAEFKFSASDGSGLGVDTFECRLDSGMWASCTSPKPYITLAEGNHDFEVRVTDKAGNTGAPVAHAWTVDTTAPDTAIDTHPQALSASATSQFSFSGTDAGSGIASYECRVDGGAWGGCTSPRNYASLADGSHAFEVRAIDLAGNADGTPAAFAWSVDGTEPATSIDTHPSSSTSSTTAEFAFTGTDTGGSGVASFQCRLDSAAPGDWSPCSSPASYSGLADGPHHFETRAIDQAGNADSTPAAFDWSIDTAAPPPPSISKTVPASPANDNAPKVVGSAPAGSTVRLYANATCSGTAVAVDSAASLAAGIAVTVPDDSTTELSAMAASLVGNTSACSAPIAYVEDSSPPQTTVDSGPATPGASSSAQFTFSATDLGGSGIASFGCRLDSAQVSDWKSCASPIAYTALVDGAHAFEVRALDMAGNADGSPARYEWTAKTTTPPTGDQDTAKPGVLAFVRLLRVRYNRRKGAALLVIEVPGPGRLSAGTPKAPSRHRPQKAGRATAEGEAQPQIEPKSIRTTRAGKVKLSVKLTPAARKLLLEVQRIKVPVEIGYEAAGGASISRTVAIVLRTGLSPRRP
jgi:hypothetical protein